MAGGTDSTIPMESFSVINIVIDISFLVKGKYMGQDAFLKISKMESKVPS